ncbi:uncharacterized protein LOC135814891 [Sycon ciliatum]|uniref:uncharacterized protein LOC135814891 n=1 Tax=Sycon ciliatum TaxID=27933 RepID=UPI0031F70BFD
MSADIMCRIPGAGCKKLVALVAGIMLGIMLTCQSSSAKPTGGPVQLATRNYSVEVVLPVPEDPVSRQIIAAVRLAIEHSNSQRLAGIGCQLVIGSIIDSFQDAWSTTASLVSAVQARNGSETAAVLGLVSSSSVRALTPVSQVTGLPMLSIAASDSSLTKGITPNLYTMYPRNEELPLAVVELIGFYSWTEVVLLNSDTHYGVSFREMFSDFAAEKSINVSYLGNIDYTGDVPSQHVYSVLEQVKRVGTKIIICNLAMGHMQPVLTAAKQLGLFSSSFAWIGTDYSYGLDLLSAKLRNESLHGMLWLRPEVHASARESFQQMLHLPTSPGSKDNLSLLSMYAYDAVSGLAAAVDDCCSNGTLNTPDLVRSSSLLDKVQLGPTFISACVLDRLPSINFTSTTGETRDLSKRFSVLNTPQSSRFEIVNIVHGSAVLIGQWSPLSRLTIDAEKEVVWPGNTIQMPAGRVLLQGLLKILVPVYSPFSFIAGVDERPGDENSKPLSNYSQDQYEGIAVDIMRRAAQAAGFSYQFYLYPYSSWTAMVALAGNKSNEWDLAIGGITLTKERSKTCDFTRSVYLTGLRMLVLRPTEVQSSIWAFVSPFSWKVWLVLFMMFIAVGLLMLYFDPAGVNFRKNSGVPLSDSMFYSFSSFFFTQETDGLQAPMGRLFSGTVLFVVLIISAAYTAQLSYYLSTREGTRSVEEFADLPSVWVGAAYGGSIYPYVTQELGLRKVRTVTGDEAVLAALRSGQIAAFISDIPSLEGVAAKACDTYVTGRMTYTQQYAFAAKKDAPWLDEVNRAISIMLSNGTVSQLFSKYVPSTCSKVTSIDNIKPLTLKDLTSLVLLVGVAVVLSVAGKVTYMLFIYPKKKRRYARIVDEASSVATKSSQKSSTTLLESDSSRGDSGVADVQPYPTGSRAAFESRPSSAAPGLFQLREINAANSLDSGGTIQSPFTVQHPGSEDSRELPVPDVANV